MSMNFDHLESEPFADDYAYYHSFEGVESGVKHRLTLQ